MSSTEDKSTFFLRNTLVLYGIGTAAAVARIFIRSWATRAIGLEEVIMFFALLCWTGDTFLITVVVEKGTNHVAPGIDRGSIPWAEAKRREIGSKSFVSAWFLYTTAIWGCKLAILMFYKRLTDRVAQRKAVKVTGVVLAATYVACILGVALVCRPFSGNWTVSPDPGPACTDGLHFVWLVGILNILTDIMLLAIPMPLLLQLQVSLMRRILLGSLLGLGIFVIIATILRIHFTVSSSDISNMTFWSMIETATLFIVANAPGIQSIFTRKKTHSSSAHTGSPPTGAGNTTSTGKPTGIPTNPASDSQERLTIDEKARWGSVIGPMVIHQNITYDVVIEENTCESDGSSGGGAGGGMAMDMAQMEPVYSANATAGNRMSSNSRVSGDYAAAIGSTAGEGEGGGGIIYGHARKGGSRTRVD